MALQEKITADGDYCFKWKGMSVIALDGDFGGGSIEVKAYKDDGALTAKGSALETITADFTFGTIMTKCCLSLTGSTSPDIDVIIDASSAEVDIA